MRIEIKDPYDRKIVTNLSRGQFGRGSLSGDLYVGTDHGVLTFPELRHYPNPEVERLPPGTVITITV